MRRLAWGAGLIGGFPPAAHAHLVNTGFGPYYDGLAHVLMAPADLLAVVALGLLGGLNGVPQGRALFFLLPSGWLGGGAIGLAWPGIGLTPLFGALSLGVLGVLVALDRSVPRLPWLVLVAGVGLLYGYANGSALGASGEGWLPLAGSATAVAVLAALLPAAVLSLHAQWARIAVRVVGSWIVASSILMLGWIGSGQPL